MKDRDIEKQKFPIGKFIFPAEVTKEYVQKHIQRIDSLPGELRQLVSGFTEDQLNTVYREGGWTVRQVINHIADSHVNAYIRFKCALTESTPVIKPYLEAMWAELPDGKNCDPEISLKLIDALHYRWVMLLRSVSKDDFKKGFFHPEHGKIISLGAATGSYSWHGDHHFAHISGLKERMGW